MRLDLHEIIDNPGSSKDFAFLPDFSGMRFDVIEAFTAPVEMQGCVQNSAGLLTLSATLRAELVCTCARCARSFPKKLDLPIELTLAADAEDMENPDLWPLEDDILDLDEVALTAFVLDLDAKLLCKADCKGLCPRCGKNLNDGPCTCKPDVDPRLAVLEQLLKDNQED